MSSLIAWGRYLVAEIGDRPSILENGAMDVAIGAAYANQRAMVVMKSVGMNVAADSFFYAVYTGLLGMGSERTNL